MAERLLHEQQADWRLLPFNQEEAHVQQENVSLLTKQALVRFVTCLERHATEKLLKNIESVRNTAIAPDFCKVLISDTG